ncbi:hypothetical protein SAMN05444285_10915 [Draconibacterium orientale]|uniref:Uncharacterized protein n=1 Tax=Draconibacterium orientale TaxID=1168034 RepID=X5DFJ3_9BACT|nr:hypothetical protein [Draconibacterium orientale]AHW61703.1 hypothetical protein FH5T_06840 [Draconibacterium orientale]SET26303.1 hypothetical protein SAMN05444285_10915 [Draconibacterium orientale]
MKYNIHNIWKGNAPPIKRQKLRPIKSDEIPIEASGAKGKRQKACSLWLEACSSNTFYFFLSTFSLTLGQLLLNMRDGFTRHAQRDGPRGRAPAIRFAPANGFVTLNQKSSVSLCVYSALSAVKNKNTTERALHTRHNRAIYAPNPTKAFRHYCTGNVRMQEEKVNVEGKRQK